MIDGNDGEQLLQWCKKGTVIGIGLRKGRSSHSRRRITKTQMKWEKNRGNPTTDWEEIENSVKREAEVNEGREAISECTSIFPEETAHVLQVQF